MTASISVLNPSLSRDSAYDSSPSRKRQNPLFPAEKMNAFSSPLHESMETIEQLRSILQSPPTPPPPIKEKPLSLLNRVRNMTPERNFPFGRTVYNNPGIILSPRTKKKARVIYRIKNTLTNECYIGKTERPINQRVNEHNFYFRHFEKEMGQSRLYQEMREHPENFIFGILYEAQEDEDLEDVEVYYIGLKNSYENGYNQNEGGGGPSQEQISHSESVNYSKIQKENIKPMKWYPINEQTCSFTLTPSHRSTRNVIYMIKEEKTNKIYIGKTSTTFARRVYAHNTCIHSLKEKNKTSLYEAIREHPECFKIGIVYIAEEGENLGQIESELIQEFESHKEEVGYNRNKGGGGGQASFRKVRPFPIR